MPSVRTRDSFALALFSLAWLLPVTYHGFHAGEKIPGFPARFAQLTNVSCLFRASMSVWPYDYVQVQGRSGEPWVTLDERDYFQMPAFGHRTRFDELLRRSLGERSLPELLVWMRARHAARHPDQPPPEGIRLIAGHFRVGDPIRPGHWRKPPLEEVPIDRRQVWYELRFGTEPAGAAGPAPDPAPR